MTMMPITSGLRAENRLLRESCRLRSLHISLLIREERILLEDKRILMETNLVRDRMIKSMKTATYLIRGSLNRRRDSLEKLKEKADSLLDDEKRQTLQLSAKDPDDSSDVEEDDYYKQTERRIEQCMGELALGRKKIEAYEMLLQKNSSRIAELRREMQYIDQRVQGYHTVIEGQLHQDRTSAITFCVQLPDLPCCA